MREAITGARGSWNADKERAQFRMQLELPDTRMVRAHDADFGFVMTRNLGAGSIQVHTLCIAIDQQGRGYGATVMRDIMNSAAITGAALDVSVLKSNPRAKALYLRLAPSGRSALRPITSICGGRPARLDRGRIREPALPCGACAVRVLFVLKTPS